MKKIVYVLLLPFVWLWKFLHSGVTVLFNLLVLGCILLAVVAAVYTPEVKVPTDCALVLAPVGEIVEERSPIDPLTRVMSQLTDTPLHEETFLQDIIDAVEVAAEDPRIKMLVLNTNRMTGASLDQVQTIGTALAHFKENGKQVIAIGDSFNQGQYLLASWADKIYLHPMGTVNLRGFAVYRLYLKEMLDKLAINFHVFRVGTFKSAVEPLLRNDMSPEDEEASRLWLGNLWETYSAQIITNRKLDGAVFKDNVNRMVTRLTEIGGDRALLAAATGLVDGLKSRQELEELFIAQVGPSRDKKSFNHISFQDYLQTFTPSYSEAEGKQELIGIITASGNILPGEGGVGQIGADDLIKRIRKARQDQRIKAIVLRINSGGGSAFASELIRQELVQAKKAGKVVVVSMGAMTASGGYWLAADADAIVAAPTTLTGSIGIFGAIPTVEQTLAKIGVHGDGVGTTDIAHFGNLTSAMSKEEAAALQMDVERGYGQFLEIVSQGRHLPRAEVDKMAEGRVWDGATALRLGLVDKLGDLDTAMAEAARLAKVPVENGLYIELTPDNVLERFKRVDQPVEALVSRLLGASPLAAPLRQVLREQVEVLLPSGDPGNLYAHTLLPPSALRLH